MTEPGYRAKYLRVNQPITDADLAAHLTGDITLACVLQRDDLSYIAACDIDTGGEAMVRRVMRAAETRACHAYGFVLDSDTHSGGHVWLFFEHAHTARDLQALMRDIVSDAQCPTTEIYPNGADLRLPFGLHRRCKRRGLLLLNSAAAPLDLDTDFGGVLATFLIDVRLTSDLPVRVAQEAQQARRIAVANAIAAARPRQCGSDAHWREVIANFNQSTDLISLLEGYGARAVYHYPGGKTLLHCAASADHAHGDAHPSLVVERGRGHQTGRMICGCYSPACRLHNQPGQVMDAFEVFCRLEGITKREGVQRIQSSSNYQIAGIPRTPSTASSNAPPPAALHTRPPSAAYDLPSQSPVPSPQSLLAQQRLVEVQMDRRVQPLDRRLLAYVISHGAHGQGIANATLAAALGARPDSIKRAKRRLRELGYIDVAISTDGTSPSAITIVAPEGMTDVEGGVQTAPPFHVSESTCIGETPPPESNSVPVPEGELVPPRSKPSEADLRRRRSVLLNMLRGGVPERRRLAFTAELAAVERVLDQQTMTLVEPSTTSIQDVHYQPQTSSLQPSASSPYFLLAQPDEFHPPVTDAQLTTLLRDTLHDCLTPTLRLLLERVSWRQEDKGIVLVCEARDLAPATEHILGVSRLALAELGIPGVGSVVMVQIGKPAPADVQPPWLDDTLWMRVPIWLRPLLVGSVLVNGRLYGATVERTRGLASHGEVVRWLLDQVAHVSSLSHSVHIADPVAFAENSLPFQK